MKSNENAKNYAEKLVTLLAKKMDIDISKYDMSELVMGMLVELEHGSKDERTNITNDEPSETIKIVLAHLNELPDYYTRLEKMEKEAKSVKTKKYDDDSEDKKEEIIENTSKRFRELCGIIENEQKKQLKNSAYQEKNKKTLLNEVDSKKFNVIKFSNDGLGEKTTEEEIDLYGMDSNKDK